MDCLIGRLTVIDILDNYAIVLSSVKLLLTQCLEKLILHGSPRYSFGGPETNKRQIYLSNIHPKSEGNLEDWLI